MAAARDQLLSRMSPPGMDSQLTSYSTGILLWEGRHRSRQWRSLLEGLSGLSRTKGKGFPRG